MDGTYQIARPSAMPNDEASHVWLDQLFKVACFGSSTPAPPLHPGRSEHQGDA